MIYINITNFILINELEKDHSMMERCRLNNVVLFYPNKKECPYLSEVYFKYTSNILEEYIDSIFEVL